MTAYAMDLDGVRAIKRELARQRLTIKNLESLIYQLQGRAGGSVEYAIWGVISDTVTEATAFQMGRGTMRVYAATRSGEWTPTGREQVVWNASDVELTADDEKLCRAGRDFRTGLYVVDFYPCD